MQAFQRERFSQNIIYLVKCTLKIKYIQEVTKMTTQVTELTQASTAVQSTSSLLRGGGNCFIFCLKQKI